MQYDKQDGSWLDKFPALPDKLAENAPGLIGALHAAMETTDAEAVRYATNCVQFQGRSGQIAATDGRELLVQSGFKFPWDDDLLVPRTTVFGCKELPADTEVLVGRTGDHVTFCLGPWTLHLEIQKDGRFPHVADHISQPDAARAVLQIAPSDAEFLQKAVKRLPGTDAYNEPLTIDLNGSVALRAKGNDQTQATELVLSASECSGVPLRINTNRRYLERAVKLGFDRVHLFAPEAPVLCQDNRRSYLWAVLDAESAIKPSKDAIRIESARAATSQAATSEPQSARKRRRKPNTMPRSQTNRTATQETPASTNGHATQTEGIDAVIEYAENLKNTLRQAAGQTSELIVQLKRHRKQSKAVRSTLASLRQLQAIDA